MPNTLLITSFATWLPHHTTNAADDLLRRFREREGEKHHYLRHVPVDFDLAPQQVIAHFEALQPRFLVCCGMAEERDNLCVESRAVLGDDVRQTPLDLEKLIEGLGMTEISHNAGDFVCNTLYHRTLTHLHAKRGEHYALFVHVPRLTGANVEAVTEDFCTLIERLAEL